MRFSIIIPAFGAEKSIEKCINSVCLQNFPKDRYEVIVVDDCSFDQQNNVIEKLIEKYSNLTLLKHKENKRQGGARNTGLRVAKGEYIIFLDSDDYWCYDTVLKKFDIALKETNADIMLSSKVKTEYNEPVCNHFFKDDVGRMSVNYKTPEDWILRGSMIGSVVMGAYRRSLIEDNNIYFREKVTSEDSDWNCKILVHADKIAITDFCFYVYVMNAVSTIHTYKLFTLTNEIDCDSIILDFFNKTDKVSKKFKRAWAIWQSKNIFKCQIMKTRHYPLRLSLKAFSYLKKSPLLDYSQYPSDFSIKCRLFYIKHLGWFIISALRCIYMLKATLIKNRS